MLLINRNKKQPQEEALEIGPNDTKKRTSSGSGSRFTFAGLFRRKQSGSSVDGSKEMAQDTLQTKPVLPRIRTPQIDDNVAKNSSCSTTFSGSGIDELKEFNNQNSKPDYLPPNETPSTSNTTSSKDSMVPSILDDGNYITMIQSGDSIHPNGSNVDHYGSFTTDCISLQNSDMTSHFDEEHNYSPVGMRLLKEDDTKLTLKSILKKKKTDHHFKDLDDNSYVGSRYSMECPDLASMEGNEESGDSDGCDSPRLSRSICSGDELLEALSDSESDLNFDPLQEENANDYKQGGYHPVQKGETYYSKQFPNKEYLILRKLGWGHFSTVWLAKSMTRSDIKGTTSDANPTSNSNSKWEFDDYVAIKFVKSSKNYMEAAEDEIKILQTINKPLLYGNHLTVQQKNFFKKYHFNKNNEPTGHPGFKHVMKLLDNFEITGPNGSHICMVFEILGENVFNMMCKYKAIYNSLSKEVELKKNDLKKCSSHESSSSKIANSFTLEDINFNKKDSKKKSTVSKLSLGLIGNNKEQANPDPKNPYEAHPSPDGLQKFSYNNMKTLEEKIKSLDDCSIKNLLEQSKTYGGLPLILVKQIFKQIFLAMDYIHHCGVIHTDLKPENILIEIKDINKLIKMIENETLAKQRERKMSESSKSSKNSGGRKASINSSIPSRQSSCKYTGYKQSRTSMSRSVSHTGSYGGYDSPIRSSKPLLSSITSDIIFKNVSYQSEESSLLSSPNDGLTLSPTDYFKNSVRSTRSINGNTQKDFVISVKIADLGNGTFANEHFTNQIQTRQYRSPEIILGYKNWGASTDLWSLGCMLFELITGDYLFDPHEGKSYDRDDDHIAQIIELLGEFPSKEYISQCCHARDFFKISGSDVKMKKIPHLKIWTLTDVLVEKYHFNPNDANLILISDLISKCLSFDPKDRVDAGALSNHAWFDNCGDNDHLDRSFDTKGDDVPGYSSTYTLEEEDEEISLDI